MMKKNTQSGSAKVAIIVVLIALMLLAMGFLAFSKLTKSKDTTTSTSTITRVNVKTIDIGADIKTEDIDNAVYTVWGNTVKFTSGRFKRGNTPADKGFINSSVVTYGTGDINGDKHEDALVETSTSIGNAFTYELHALIKQNGVATSTLLKIPVDSGYVRTVDDMKVDSKGVISLALAIVPPGGANCCPSVHLTNKYTFNGKELVRVTVASTTPAH